jgi:tetratricopeptide (TPR) repeat protein
MVSPSTLPMKKSKTSFFLSLIVITLFVNSACVRKLGRSTNDNFYVIKKNGKKPSGSLDDPFGRLEGRQLSESINATLKAQAKNSPKSKSSVTNAELLEKENSEFSSLLARTKARPQSGETQFLLAKAYHDFRMYDEAQLHYQKAIQLEPENPVYYEQSGRLWRDRGAPRFGVNSLQKALQLRPDFIEAWNTLGILYDRMGEPKKAQESYFEALELNPKLDYVHTNLCYSFLQEGNLEKAIYHGEKAIALAPSDVAAHNNLGLAYGMLGEFEKAYQEFRQVGDEAIARNNLGLVLLKRNQIADAMREFQLAGRSKPFYRVAAENYTIARNLDFESKRKNGSRTGEHSMGSGVLETSRVEIASPLIPLNHVGIDPLHLLRGSFIPASFRTDLELLPKFRNSNVKSRLKLEIEGSSGLIRQSRLLGEFLRDHNYRLARIVETPGQRSRTVIYYRPGYSKRALELAHKIPGSQFVLRADHPKQMAELRIAVGSDIRTQLRKLRTVDHGQN